MPILKAAQIEAAKEHLLKMAWAVAARLAEGGNIQAGHSCLAAMREHAHRADQYRLPAEELLAPRWRSAALMTGWSLKVMVARVCSSGASLSRSRSSPTP
jgi:hypothetical protein